MNRFEIALEMEFSYQYEKAIDEYEQAIMQNEDMLDVYINLAFLYWLSSTQFTWADEYNISEKIRRKGINRYADLLGLAMKKFPSNSELHFWKRYFLHRITYEPLNENDVLEILSHNKAKSLVPYFFLYLFNENKYKTERDILLEECKRVPTAKNLYIKSLIE